MKIETDVKWDFPNQVLNVEITVYDLWESYQTNELGQMVLNIKFYDIEDVQDFIHEWRCKENYVSIICWVDLERVIDVADRPYKSVGFKQIWMTDFILSFYG